MRKNNILFLYQYFGTPNGSWSTRCYELTKRWVETGYNVTVITAPYEKSDIKISRFIENKEIDGIKLKIINAGDSNRYSIFKRIFMATVFAVVSIYYALTQKYDVCIASSGPITIGMPLIIAKCFRRKKTIFEVRDLWPAGGIEMGLIRGKFIKNAALYFEKMCYYSADAIVTASIGQKDLICNRYKDLRVEIIPNASDIDLFGRRNTLMKLPENFIGKKLFTHIGSLGLIHNTRYWVDVARELKKIDKNNDVQIIFIGDGKDRELLVKETKIEGLNNVHFLGLKPKKELPFWVHNSVATLFATLENQVQDASSPNKIFDSFAAGVPIIQTSRGWIKHLVETENCGINVMINDPYGAAIEILKLSISDNLIKEMGNNALRLAQTTFNRDLLATNYLKIIDEI